MKFFLILFVFFFSIITYSQSKVVTMTYVKERNDSGNVWVKAAKNGWDTSKIYLYLCNGFDGETFKIYFNNSLVYSGKLTTRASVANTGVYCLENKKYPSNYLVIKDKDDNILLEQYIGNKYYNVLINKEDQSNWNLIFSNNVIGFN